MNRMDSTERIKRNSTIVNGCWIWLGMKTPEGYGIIKVNGKRVKAHRYAYTHLVCPIPEGLTIDHLCRHKDCVNPEHLEPVTASENTKRGVPYRKIRRCLHNRMPSSCYGCGKKKYYISRGERFLCRTLLHILTKTTG